MIHSIIKRDGRVVLYDQNKIASAVLRSMEAAQEGDASDAARIANDVQRDLEHRFPSQAPNIEAIQDAVERQLMNHGFSSAAKAYILYRANRTRAREASTTLMKTIDEITNIDARASDMKRDNANIDGNTAMGSMLQMVLPVPRLTMKFICCARNTPRLTGTAISTSTTLTSTPSPPPAARSTF
jgi:ribonucleoside-triphosphate reductase